MPMYEFKCDKCGKTVVVRIDMDKSDWEQRCPKCHTGMRKLLNFGGVSFKGGGFYSTDKKSG